MSRRIIITGGSGFIGQSLVRRLIDIGDDVTVWTRKKTLLAENERSVDYSDASSVERAIEDFEPSVIIHLSGQPDPQISWNTPAETIESNLISTLHLLDIQRRLKGFRLVVTSSSSVAPFMQADVDSANITPYALAKYGCEVAFRMFVERFDLDSVLARPFAIIGPGKENDVVSDFCKQACEVERGQRDCISPIGSLNSLRDFVYIEDCVSAFELIAKLGEPGRCYDICRGRGIAISEIIGHLNHCATKPIYAVSRSVRTLKVGQTSVLVGDPHALLALGWSPTVSLGESVRRTFDFWRRKNF